MKLKDRSMRMPAWGIPALLLIGCGMGLAFGHRIWAPGAAAPEPAAVEERYSPRAVAAARDPAAPVQPAKRIPAGTRAVRVAQAVLLPDDPRCRPVTVTATLAKEASGAQRVVFEADGATIQSAIDRPLQDALAVSAPRRWAAGATYEPVRQLYGAFLERDLWRVRVGVDAQQTRTGDADLRVRIGITF